ncbi:hypothetical protein HYT54_04100 [Candidatus Woesearchaeota archaeon]|nr:hypothetical protein [Candidatus Woesearchaeota archaeon]
MLPVYLLNTIMATFIIITVYFVLYSLYGFLPAILSSILLIFSPRDFMPYLWGQWPERFAYAFIPIILYCFYKYYLSYNETEKKGLYFYLTAIFLGIQLLIHPLVFFHSVVSLAVLYALLFLKFRKFAFNLKHIIAGFLIFAVLFLAFPIQTFNIFSTLGIDPGEKQKSDFELGRLFQWSLNPKDYAGSVPPSYFSFSEMHGLWTLPFLLAGIAILVIRRQERDLFMLAWLISLYLILHRDFIGKATFLHRSLSATAHIFAPLTAIGAVYIVTLFRIPDNTKKYVKYALAGVFIYFIFSVNFAYAAKLLNKDTYNDFFSTLNEPEYKAAQWVLENVPPAYNVSILGIPHADKFVSVTSKKIRWMGAASQRVNRFYYLLDDDQKDGYARNNYVMLDYTMVGPINDVELYNDMQQFEKEKLANRTLVYDNDNIKVYKP